MHLDSPLIGLACKSPDFAKRVETASRQALDNLVALAIEEGCRFVVLAGDIFDGELKNYQAGLYFMGGMRRLSDAGIDVFVVLGNHNSANQFAAKLSYSEQCTCVCKVAPQIEGPRGRGRGGPRSHFPRWDFDENMARDYPAAIRGVFNIGLLHTACAGSEGEHARYAPCTIEQLANHGYEYWALGHVHGYAVLSEAPHIVYSGNLQGRHSREDGAKGAVLVNVDDGAVTSLEHRALDVVRWEVVRADISSHADRSAICWMRCARLSEESLRRGRRSSCRVAPDCNRHDASP